MKFFSKPEKVLFENKSLSSKYWEQYFNLKSRNSKNKESYKINGFVDKKLVNTIRGSLRKILKKNKYEIIIDCGCGDGSVTGTLSKGKIRIIGLDMSLNMCKLAKLNGLETYKKDLYSLKKLSFEKLLNIKFKNDKNKKCVVFCESLGCLEKPIEIIEGVINNNKFIDSILISFPNQKSVIRNIVNFFHKNEINYFALSEIKKISQNHQYFISELQYIVGIPLIYNFTVSIKNKNIKNKNLKKFFLELVSLNIVLLINKKV